MSELELTPIEPAPTQTSLLRRLFRAKDIGFYLMIVLAWIGAVYTTYDLDTSRWYWHWLIPIFGAICIITQWNNVEPTLKARLLLVVRQDPALGGAAAADWHLCLHGSVPQTTLSIARRPAGQLPLMTSPSP